MDDIAEKRVFTQHTSAFQLIIPSAIGTVRVQIADDRVGSMELIDQHHPTDITITDTEIAIATDTDVYLWTDSAVEATDFGPATAVDYHNDTLRAASPTGAIKKYTDTWESIGELDANITVLDADFVGTDTGVYHLTDDLSHAGLTAVNDISATTIPLVATDNGLYELANGWHQHLPGRFAFVQAHSHDPNQRAHAATTDTCYERTDDWHPLSLPTSDPIIDATYTTHPILISNTGTIYIKINDHWTHHALGITNPTKLLTIRPTPSSD